MCVLYAWATYAIVFWVDKEMARFLLKLLSSSLRSSMIFAALQLVLLSLVWFRIIITISKLSVKLPHICSTHSRFIFKRNHYQLVSHFDYLFRSSLALNARDHCNKSEIITYYGALDTQIVQLKI